MHSFEGDQQTLEGRAIAIYVKLDGSHVPVERSVFTSLFEESIVSGRAPYLQTLRTSTISFDTLVDLARKAEIPYVLFFAPQEVVDQQLKKKTDTLLAGVSKRTFSMNSRSRVRLNDIELIVKDILRKQELLKKLDNTLEKNPIAGVLRRSRNSVVQDSEILRTALGFTTAEVKAAKNKGTAFNLLIDRFEARQLFVSQSQPDYMPQRVPRGVKFSGMSVRDKKIPFLFLTGGDEGDNPEPVGRKMFTLVLLAVFVAQGKFAPVTYNDQTGEPITNREYELAEELLMPTAEVRHLDVSTLDAVKACADTYRVTPSSFVMRARRLNMISRPEADYHLSQLAAEFAQRKKPQARRPKAVRGIQKYNGVEFSRRMVHQLDQGSISAGEFCRVVCLNKIKPTQIHEFRAAL